jgi:putative transposase
MSRFRLQPMPAQEQALLEHCAHARFVWNLACEQYAHWRPGRAGAPGFAEQCRQLTGARAEFAWLAGGSVIVQQQALKDFAQTMANYFGGTHRRPTWRKAGRHEGFRVVGQRGRHWDVRRLSRKVGEVRVPKVGWVRFRWSRQVPDQVKSFRVTRDRTARWHVAFAAIPEPIGGLKARETDRRKDWVEKTSTDLARRFDLIRVEDLKIKHMVRSARGTLKVPGKNVRAKAGLNRSIHAAGWGRLMTRLEDKAPGRVQKINPAYTSQCCSVCGTVDAKARESQAVFACRSCGYTGNADVNAAKNIAAGHAVTARGGRPVNREPQLLTSS